MRLERLEKPLTGSEFDALEARGVFDAEHYELVEGRIRAMAAERTRHFPAKHRAQAYLLRGLSPPCEAYVEARLAIEATDERYRADVLVDCRDSLVDIGENATVLNPSLIVEVLSIGGDASHDLVTKRERYFLLRSVICYVVIDVRAEALVAHLFDAESGRTFDTIEAALDEALDRLRAARVDGP